MARALSQCLRSGNPPISLHPRLQPNHPPCLPRGLRFGQHGFGRTANFGADERSRACGQSAKQCRHLAQRAVPTDICRRQGSPHAQRRGRQRGQHGIGGLPHGGAGFQRYSFLEHSVCGRRGNERIGGRLFCRQTTAHINRGQPHGGTRRSLVPQIGSERTHHGNGRRAVPAGAI